MGKWFLRFETSFFRSRKFFFVLLHLICSCTILCNCKQFLRDSRSTNQWYVCFFSAFYLFETLICLCQCFIDERMYFLFF